MSTFKLIGNTGLYSLVVAIFSIHFIGTVQAETGPGWEPAQLQKLTEGCITSVKDQAQQDAQKAANRKNAVLGTTFSSNLQRLNGKFQSTCECLTDKVSLEWTTPDQLSQVSSTELDEFVKSQLQTGKCQLPDFSK